jgi:ABC-type branched-chain amino acid transport system, permease component
MADAAAVAAGQRHRAVLLGIVTVRLSGHYLPLGTIAWGIGLFYLFSKLEFLGRNDGISGIPPLRSVSCGCSIPARSTFAIWIAVLISAILTMNLLDSRTGRAIRALRRGHIAGEAFGVQTRAPSSWCSSMRRCWPACPAGSMRISSAPPTRPVRRAGRHRISVHRRGRRRRLCLGRGARRRLV